MRKSILLPLLALLITLSIIPSARATDTRELEPVADSYVNIDHPDTNYGNYSWLLLLVSPSSPLQLHNSAYVH
ncbi:MAG: hypothetical protein Q6356_004100 [Candidatus Wukongarchaeota archaeon]|nr:hypothetical protein [Candidatus Wukongarchaeota archaeon]